MPLTDEPTSEATGLRGWLDLIPGWWWAVCVLSAAIMLNGLAWLVFIR